MQINTLSKLKLPTLPETIKLPKELIDQKNFLIAHYKSFVPPCHQEEVTANIELLTQHIAYSKTHQNKYSPNTLYFIWFLFTDTSRIKEFYLVTKNEFSPFFTTGESKKPNDSNAQLLEFLKAFYSQNKTLKTKEKTILNLFTNGFNTTSIAQTLNLQRSEVTLIVKTLSERALKYLNEFYASSQEAINEELEDLANCIWEDTI